MKKQPKTPAAPRLGDECGVALLVVLFVVTLLTIIVTEFTYSVQLDQHRARNALDSLQASLLARSAINIEESFLVMDKNEEGNFDAFTEEWWLALNEFCDGIQLAPTMRMACSLQDESGKLNINLTRMSATSVNQQRGERATKDAFARDALRRIFEAHEIDVDIVDKLEEYWLQEPPEDDEGEKRRIPDFRSIEDFAAEFAIPTRHLRELRQILTAVPRRYLRAVNANTAPGILLAALINEGNAVAAILDRQHSEDPFRNASEIRTLLQQEGVEDSSIVGGLFDVRSSLFRLRASALTNADPDGEQSGGIGQTLSVLVWRRSVRCQPGQEQPCWTLKPLDWQKEGGARLLEDSRSDSNELDSDDEFDEFDDTNSRW